MTRIIGALLILFPLIGKTQTVQYDPIAEHHFKGKIIRSYTVPAFDENQLIVGLKGGAGEALIYRSNDTGSNWEVLNGGNPLCSECEDIQSICSPEANIILAGTWKNGLFLSKDNGKSFEPVKNFEAKDVRSIVHSESGKTFAATTTHGILMSENNGKKWNSIHDESLNKSLAAWDLKIHPGSKNILYAMTFENGIYKSIDAGVTWKELVSEKGMMFWDMGFFKSEIYAVASNDSVSYLYKSFIGDKNWDKYLLNIPSSVNCMNIVRTFRDFYFLFGTWDAGMYKSYAIEHSITGFRCTEMEKDDTTGTAHIYSSENRIFDFSWGDGIKVIEREQECEVMIDPFLYVSQIDQGDWGLRSSCDLDFFHFKLYDKWGQLAYEKEAEITTVNTELKEIVKTLKQEQHIYWIKFSFVNDKETMDLKGHVEIKA